MAVDPATIAAGVGALAGLFMPKKKAPRNVTLDWLNRLNDDAAGLYGRTNFKDIDQLTEEAFSSSVRREADRATGNLLASDFANSGTPLLNSERGVAQGLIARDSAYKIADMRANNEATRPLRQQQFMAALANMAQGALQGNNAQAQLNQQAAAQGDAQIMAIANLVANSIPKSKASPTSSPAGKQSKVFEDTSIMAKQPSPDDWRYKDNFVPQSSFYNDPALFSRSSGVAEGEWDWLDQQRANSPWNNPANLKNPNLLLGSIGRMVRGIRL